MRRFHESRIVLQLSWKKQGVILTVTSRKEEHHGLVSGAVDRGRATRRQRGTGPILKSGDCYTNVSHCLKATCVDDNQNWTANFQVRCTIRVKTPLRETFVFPGKMGFFGPPTGAEPTAFWDQTHEERCCHPNLRIREKMLVLWLLHTGLTRQQAAKAAGVSRATVQRYVAAFRQGGLDGLRQWNLSRPVSEMAAYRELIRASFEKQPATTIAEACERIFQLTGLRRGPSQVRKFLKDLGLKFYRVRAIPVPPKKNLAEHVADQAAFLETELKPLLAAAQAGKGHVFFVDAAHFVFGTFLCYLWSFTRIFVRAASGRQRFNVLGAWNAVTRQLIAVTNTTVVNTETISELLRKIAALGLTGAITLVLDNARYQHNAAVKALASQLGITLLFLPSYSPNLNLIERLWKFTKRRALYGRYHPKFADFQAAIQEILDGIPTTYAKQLETLMTLNFQQFEDVSLMAA